MYGLKDLLLHEGCENVGEFLEMFGYAPMMPGICTNCGEVYYYEPDQYRGWCDGCEANTVKSGLALLGLI